LLSTGNLEPMKEAFLSPNRSARGSIFQQQLALELIEACLKKTFIRLVYNPQCFFYSFETIAPLIVFPVSFSQEG